MAPLTSLDDNRARGADGDDLVGVAVQDEHRDAELRIFRRSVSEKALMRKWEAGNLAIMPCRQKLPETSVSGLL
jgi:hypothetical protein